MDFAPLRRIARRALRPLMGWPDRGAVLRDGLLALAALVLIALENFLSWGWGESGAAEAVLNTAALGAVVLLVIVLTRLYPVLAAVVALVSVYASFVLALLLVCASFLAGRRMPSVWPAVVTFTVGVLAWLVLGLALWATEVFVWVSTLVLVVFYIVLPWLVGVYRRQQSQLTAAGWEHARHIQREHRLTAEQARLRERSRIAQDMHDSLGHELSLIALRAGALEVSSDLSDAQRQAVTELRTSAVSASARLREIIGVLRTDSEPGPTAPVDESVTALVERARNSGMSVLLVREGHARNLPPMVDRAVYRVVQESLTNAAKYASDAAVTVWLTSSDERLEVRVTNAEPRSALPENADGGRHGLIGLRERVRLAGGLFAAGPSGGGWEVCATMPLGEVTAVGPDDEEDETDDIDRLQMRARRRIRGWTLALVAIPGVCVLVMGVLLGVGTLIRLDDEALPAEELDRISVGDTVEEAQEVLPASPLMLPPDQVGELTEPEGASCDYYRSSSAFFEADLGLHQVCFRDGRVVYAGVARESE